MILLFLWFISAPPLRCGKRPIWGCSGFQSKSNRGPNASLFSHAMAEDAGTWRGPFWPRLACGNCSAAGATGNCSLARAFGNCSAAGAWNICAAGALLLLSHSTCGVCGVSLGTATIGHAKLQSMAWGVSGHGRLAWFLGNFHVCLETSATPSILVGSGDIFKTFHKQNLFKKQLMWETQYSNEPTVWEWFIPPYGDV